jgi:hypothetical protein
MWAIICKRKRKSRWIPSLRLHCWLTSSSMCLDESLDGSLED